MGHWSSVLRAFDEVARDREAIRRQREQADRARVDCAAWCERAEEQVLREVFEALERRAAELLDQVGIPVEVGAPGASPIVMQGSVRMRFLRVACGGAVMYVYVSRAPGALPFLHYAHEVRSPTARFPRLLSMPGFVVWRDPADAVVLRPCGRGAVTTVSADDVACRVLEALAHAARQHGGVSS
jgi:hypothetical protein